MPILRAAQTIAATVLVALSTPALAQSTPPAGLTDLTARQAATQIAEGRLTSAALVQALLARARDKASLNAIITLNDKGALDRAAALDAEAKAGKLRGPLHGVPLVIKDNINSAGIATSGGTPALEAFVPQANAPVLQKLIDAGALVLAKTNLHELAFGITSNNARFGAVGNAHDPGRFAGGSSGGTAAAIAAGVAPAGLGTDTGGSVRIPAALNGLAGFRPTTGRYPGEGIVPLSATRDTAGPIARTVADLVLLDGVIAGAETSMQPAPLKGVRLGLAQRLLEDIEPETKRLFMAAVDKLKAAGAEVVEPDLPDIFKLAGDPGFAIVLFEAKRDLAAYLADNKVGLTVEEVAAKVASPDVKGVFDTFVLGPKAVPEEAYRKALNEARPALQKAYADYFSAHKVEALIFPATPLPAAPIKGHDETVELNGKKVPTFPTYIRMSDPGSVAGIPGLVTPMGVTKEGLPVGFELNGPAGSDRRLLAIGLAVEAAMGPMPGPGK